MHRLIPQVADEVFSSDAVGIGTILIQFFRHCRCDFIEQLKSLAVQHPANRIGDYQSLFPKMHHYGVIVVDPDGDGGDKRLYISLADRLNFRHDHGHVHIPVSYTHLG